MRQHEGVLRIPRDGGHYRERQHPGDLASTGHPVVLAANGPVSGAHLVSYA